MFNMKHHLDICLFIFLILSMDVMLYTVDEKAKNFKFNQGWIVNQHVPWLTKVNLNIWFQAE